MPRKRSRTWTLGRLIIDGVVNNPSIYAATCDDAPHSTDAAHSPLHNRIMSTKEALRQLSHLFSPTIPSSSRSSSHAKDAKGSSATFPSLRLPAETEELIDMHLSQFAASFPIGGGGGHHREFEVEKERGKWREGLLEIWAVVEPLPGTEGDAAVIAKVSAFLELLSKLSSCVGDDDDSALISRDDIGQVWWGAVLRRTMLGTPKDHVVTRDKSRGRKQTSKGDSAKEPASPSPSASTMRPLTVSRLALTAATDMVSWAMTFAEADSVEPRDAMSPFGAVVWKEYSDRVIAMFKGLDEGYGVKNLEECMIAWADKAPEAFFHHIEPYLAHSSAVRLPFLSLLLAFVSRHSGKAYHALRTSLLPQLLVVALTSPSPAVVSVAVKCLVIFLVTLPVILGEKAIITIMAIYARIVTWELPDEVADETEVVEEVNLDEESLQGTPPDPMNLFTVLYGIYPCNFTAFLREPTIFLKEKGYKGPKDDGNIEIDTSAVKDRSSPLIRLHTLHPALFTSDLASELTDTTRWRRMEAADVMANCDRNVVQVAESRWERDLTNTIREVLRPDSEERRKTQPRNLADHATPNMQGSLLNEAAERLSQGSDRRKTPTPPSTSAEVTPAPTPGSSKSRSRSRTPLLPHSSYYTAFKALQSKSTSPRRSGSPWARAPSEDDRRSPLAMSRRSSYGGPAESPAPVSISARPRESTNAQIVRLETELQLLNGEVNFQMYLKHLHQAHMGTLHREKVLESGAEAERQSLYRTIRTLRAQLRQTRSSLEQLRSESSASKANWIAHIDDLKDKLKTLREHRQKWDIEGGKLRAQVEELQELLQKQAKETENQGAAHLDLKNQVALDAEKLDRIKEYEARIEALTKTLSLCDEDLCKFFDQRKEMNKLAAEWKRTELLRESAEKDAANLKRLLQAQEDELVHLRLRSEKAASPIPALQVPTSDSMAALRRELDRLRARNLELEEAALDN